MHGCFSWLGCFEARAHKSQNKRSTTQTSIEKKWFRLEGLWNFLCRKAVGLSCLYIEKCICKRIQDMGIIREMVHLIYWSKCQNSFNFYLSCQFLLRLQYMQNYTNSIFYLNNHSNESDCSTEIFLSWAWSSDPSLTYLTVLGSDQVTKKIKSLVHRLGRFKLAVFVLGFNMILLQISILIKWAN